MDLAPTAHLLALGSEAAVAAGSMLGSASNPFASLGASSSEKRASSAPKKLTSVIRPRCRFRAWANSSDTEFSKAAAASALKATSSNRTPARSTETNKKSSPHSRNSHWTSRGGSVEWSHCTAKEAPPPATSPVPARLTGKPSLNLSQRTSRVRVDASLSRPQNLEHPLYGPDTQAPTSAPAPAPAPAAPAPQCNPWSKPGRQTQFPSKAPESTLSCVKHVPPGMYTEGSSLQSMAPHGSVGSKGVTRSEGKEESETSPTGPAPALASRAATTKTYVSSLRTDVIFTRSPLEKPCRSRAADGGPVL
mmetsp:Transcript_2987/g.6739  ORF Transcript_2987/g.6739 Transcript_2987/m.6739 type:complete len:306 (+) Transcript_2987:1529-2446(+)